MLEEINPDSTTLVTYIETATTQTQTVLLLVVVLPYLFILVQYYFSIGKIPKMTVNDCDRHKLRRSIHS